MGVDKMGSRRSGTTPENTNLSSAFLSTLLLASIHIYFVGCGNTGMFCRSAPLFCYPNRKTCHINCIILCVL